MSDRRDQARSRWMQMFENIYPKYESLFSYGTELVVVDAETLKTYGEDGKEYTLQVAPWEVEDQLTGKLNNPDDSLLTEKSEVADTYIAGVVWGYNRGVKDCERGLQLSPETSTNGTYIRDGRLINDIVYRGEGEATDTVEESITIQTGQTYGKSANVAGDPDTDLISRRGVIDAIEGTVWYRINKNGEMVSGSTNEHESWYKHDDIMIILKTIPSPPVTHDKRTETHACDCISRQAAIEAMAPFDTNHELRDTLDALPPVELKAVCEDAISRQAAIEEIALHDPTNGTEPYFSGHEIIDIINALPPVEDMGEVSDGYHTFNQLYHQRAVLFATIVNQNKDKAWKSWKHEDGKFCFDKEKEWFIVGVDTPEGSYTYHYEEKYWDLFDCEELDRGKHWDGHTEEDVTRLLSLPPVELKAVCEDAISRADAIKTFIEWGKKEFGYSDINREERFIDAINTLPPVEPKRPKGEWVPCTEPPKDRRNVFLAHGTNDFKSCCIGHYEQNMGWYEDRNFFAKPIYDCKYWCDIPDLPDMGDNQFDMRGDK